MPTADGSDVSSFQYKTLVLTPVTGGDGSVTYEYSVCAAPESGLPYDATSAPPDPLPRATLGVPSRVAAGKFSPHRARVIR